MDANNAETNLEAVADTEGTPENSSVEVEQSTTAEAGITEPESSEQISDLVYDIGGEEVSAITVQEWKENGLRQSDYTKKSQANAETRKALEAEQLKVSERVTSLDGKIKELDDAIKAGQESTDWDYLRENDISEYTRKKEELESKQAASTKAKQEALTLQGAEDEKRLSIEQQLLAEAMPSWVDPKQKDADVQLVESYVKGKNFNNEDFNKLTSHKLMLMAIDAAKYKELIGKNEETEKAVQKAPNVIKATPKKTKPAGATRSLYKVK